MIKEFSAKLDKLLTRRNANKKNAKKEISDAPDYIAKAEKIDKFLEELGIDTKAIENAYYKMHKKINKRTSKSKEYLEANCIDKAIAVSKEKKEPNKQLFNELSAILNNNHQAELCKEAAIALAAISVSRLKYAKSYKECLEGKKYLDKAFEVLIKDNDNSVYYAQWGKCIYDYCVPKTLDEKNELACVEELKDAYSKLEKVKDKIKDIDKHKDWRLGDVNIEAALRMRLQYPASNSAEENISFLFEHMEGIDRPLIKQYRYELLEKAIVRMAKEEKNIDEIKELIRENESTFDGGNNVSVVDKIMGHYREYVYRKKKKDINEKVDQYIAEGQYRDCVPEKYIVLKATKYTNELKAYMVSEALKLSKRDSVSNASKEMLDDISERFFDINESKLDGYVESDRIEAVNRDYRDRLNSRIQSIAVIPEYAGGYVENVNEYRKQVNELCTTEDKLSAVDDIARNSEVGYSISLEIVEGYVNDAEELLKRKYDEKREQERKEQRNKELFAKINAYITEKKYLDQIKSKYKNVDEKIYLSELRLFLNKKIVFEGKEDSDGEIKKNLDKFSACFFKEKEEKLEDWLATKEKEAKEKEEKEAKEKLKKANTTVTTKSTSTPTTKYASTKPVTSKPVKKEKKPKKPIDTGDIILNLALVAKVAIIIVVAIFIGSKFIKHMGESIKEKQAYDVSDEGIEKNNVAAIAKDKAKLSPTATPASEFSYKEGNNYMIITKYNGTSETVEIPAVIEGKNVCEISNDAFKDNILIKKIIMPDTIVYIKPGAFLNCKMLEEIEFSKNLTSIGNDAFKGCEQLKNVSISGDKISLKEIGKGVFAGCISLENASISTDAFAEITLKEGAFNGCSSLKSVVVKGEKIENLAIDKNAFFDCKALTSIEIDGDKITDVMVGEAAFENCESLSQVSFSDKITKLDSKAFKNCVKLEGFDFSKLTCVPYQAFMNCTSLTKAHFPATMGEIQNDAFLECTSLAEITFESAKLAADNDGYVIGQGAFKQTAVSEVDIPGQYKEIGAHAFASCPNLTKFVFHNSGKNTLNQKFAFNAFYESYALKEVYLPKTIGGTMEDFRNIWTPEKMGDFTVYAAEGSTVHTYVTEKNIPWKTWTE